MEITKISVSQRTMILQQFVDSWV